MKWRPIDLGYKDRLATLAKLSPRELLQVPEDVAGNDLKEAYLRLIKTYHPDRADAFIAKHNEEVVKLINAAYDKLRETAK